MRSPSIFSRRKRLKAVQAAMESAEDYAAWRALAAEHDEMTGATAWREDADCRLYDALLLDRDTESILRLREQGRIGELISTLETSILRHEGDITAPELYERACLGTKRAVERYLDAVEGTLTHLATQEIPGFSRAEKLERLKRADRIFGRSALMLSGGATLGFYHLGVIKALWLRGLLPTVLSGSSMGALIGCGIATRTDPELAELFDDPSDVWLEGLSRLPKREALRRRHLLDPAPMFRVIQHNVGDWTFREAHERTGRVMNVSVSPTREGQKPRILNHITAPDALMPIAALASSAIPLAYPPVELAARTPDGGEAPWIPGETWIDGSMGEDLPTRRVGRLFNINHFIVSQVNPHVLPFLGLRRPGVSTFTLGLAGRALRAQTLQSVSLAAEIANATPVGPFADLLYGLVAQDYRGDIDIHPRFDAELYSKVMQNPSRRDLDRFILEGERATWPRVARIRDHTLISRIFERCIALLERPHREA